MFNGPIIELHISNIHGREGNLPEITWVDDGDSGHYRSWTWQICDGSDDIDRAALEGLDLAQSGPTLDVAIRKKIG